MSKATDLTVKSVVNFLSKNPVTVEQVPQLIKDFGHAWYTVLGNETPTEPVSKSDAIFDVDQVQSEHESVEETESLQAQLQREFEERKTLPEPMFED